MTEKRKSLRTLLINAPYLLWAALFIVIPLVIVVYYAFTDKNGSFSLAALTELSDYAYVFFLSALYSVIATVITLIIAYPFAYFMSRTSPASQKLQMMLVMLPMWMNLLIRTYSWMNILEKNGIINSLLETLGLPSVTMIGTPGAVILGMVYNYLPYMILPIYTAMSKIEPSLLEAAMDLGCSGWQKLRRLILPLSLPGVISGIVMVFVPSVSTFYISQKLGGGKIMLVGDIIERQMIANNNYNLGASLSLVLMVVILICMAVLNRLTDADEGGLMV